MECPLLIYKDGRFTVAEPVPDWYAEIDGKDTDDWEAIIKNAEFKAVGSVNSDEYAHHVEVFVRDDNIFYAEFWDANEEVLWCATFGWEDWPTFLAQFVLPSAHGQLLLKLDEIHREIVEYLVRNEPGNPEAAHREREWKRAQERKRERAAERKRAGASGDKAVSLARAG
jgi:hypothetical protein